MPDEANMPPRSSTPADCHGATLDAYDIVRLLRLPDWDWPDTGRKETKAAFRNHKPCYGLVTYARRPDRDGWRRWHGPDGHIFIEVVKAAGQGVTAYGLVVPSSFVERLPYNSIIMNIFANYDWPLGWEKTLAPEDIQLWEPRPPEVMEEAVTSGTKAFEVIKAILDTPYDTLVAAHNAAARVILSK